MSYIGNPIVTQAFVTDQFNGNGSTTAFTMSVAPANTASILVAVSGVVQDPSTYSVNGLTLTFSAAPPSGTGNISVRYLGIPASGVTNTAYRTITEFTATAGQTTFSTPSYTVGYISVYRNGVRLGAADFTATNGTTVVLASGATVGDLVVTESFFVSSVLNAIPATVGAVNDTYLNTGAVTQSKLATGVAGTGPAFSVYANVIQNPTLTTNTKVLFQVKDFDTNNNFESSRFTPTVAGYYQVNAKVRGVVTTTFTGMQTLIYKNGINQSASLLQATLGNSYNSVQISEVIYMNGTTDYLEVYTYFSGTGTVVLDNPTATSACRFSGTLVRSA